ncbi:winged helix-turn-helix transcriptional regulator [Rhodococcoides fascians]|uniref:winged helix-turn-helix transcriptional regulator n=1 Tax=Rhodococcoides fascians TaxID=1828 RepID=UPI00050CD050|nr:helix-turn-helix domain-containing protein [Rhodococcus fascians]
MKSYGEFCALARALDLVGDRWTMLVVRELLIGPSRYSDLHRSLPGIATNLLATRLRDLEETGIVESSDAPAPVSARVYSLTEWGRGLRAPLVELARWGVPLMASGAGEDHTRGRWLGFAIMALFPDHDPAQGSSLLPTVTVRIDTEADSVLMVSDTAGVRVSVASESTPAEIVVTGSSEEVFRTLSGHLGNGEHARVAGTTDAVRRFFALTGKALTSGAPATGQ